MPTSVLLAILAGAGLLALAPALVRRYDADERIAAEREESAARVLERKPRNRTGPGAHPINPSDGAAAVHGKTDGDLPAEEASGEEDPADDGLLVSQTPPMEPDTADETGSQSGATGWERSGVRRANSVRWAPDPVRTTLHSKEVPVTSARLRTWWRKRYRRVLFVLLALNFVELLGVALIGPGFWVGVAVSAILLVAFVRFLRLRVLRESSRQRRTAGVLASGRQVYVPPQADGEPDADQPAAIEAAADSPSGLVPGFDDADGDAPVAEADAEPAAPSRRRTGGIRGRSYESPANL
jgi:hypothetical protein